MPNFADIMADYRRSLERGEDEPTAYRKALTAIGYTPVEVDRLIAERDRNALVD